MPWCIFRSPRAPPPRSPNSRKGPRTYYVYGSIAQAHLVLHALIYLGATLSSVVATAVIGMRSAAAGGGGAGVPGPTFLVVMGVILGAARESHA